MICASYVNHMLFMCASYHSRYELHIINITITIIITILILYIYISKYIKKGILIWTTSLLQGKPIQSM